ncbi:MAG: Zn-dependent exopeptidase M28 [Phycisphaerales bacterium]|nr:MAG: Zn-dependent exopeptidase M28 [Phycisphaerales bacterium]
MEGIRMLRQMVLFFLAGLAVAPALPALASPEGEIAAALVSEENYRHILDDMLYTHAGDDRMVFGADHDPARTNIYNLFDSYGLPVALEPFDFLEEFTLYNVVATKVGVTDPTVEYVIGAHYDSDSWAEAPGADDNASGVALVLEAARVLSAYPSDYTIRFVAFDGEEWGLWGAYAYVDTHSTDDIHGMISADMVSYNTGENSVDIDGWSVSGPWDIKDAIAEAVAAYGNGLGSIIYTSTCCSDHMPFLEAGLQAALVIEDWGNPNYHTPFDNVDVPNYIDYAYATRVTRSLVGFLVDNAGVNVDVPDADYDGDGDVDLDDFDVFATCYSGSGNPPATGCEFFDLDGDNDVDCDDWRLFEVLWTGPGDPPTLSLCLPCFPSSSAQPETLALAGDPVSQKVRYLSFSAGDAGRSQAVRISFNNLPAPYHVWNDVEMWVQEPTTYCEHSAKKMPPDCPPAEPFTEWTGATLGCDPWFGDFYSAGVIHVFHEGIIPGGNYLIEVVDATCDWANKPWSSFSDPLVLAQSAWADLVNNCVTCPCGPPDGSTGIPTDVTAVLDKFKNLKPPDIPCAAVTKVRADLDEQTPDQLINISDVTYCLDAFRGFQYPPDSFPPPSSPPCGA